MRFRHLATAEKRQWRAFSDSCPRVHTKGKAMVASGAIAASAVVLKAASVAYFSLVASAPATATAATTVASTPFMGALYTSVGAIIGATVTGAVSIVLAIVNKRGESKKEAIRRAYDSASSPMAVMAFNKYAEFCQAYGDRYQEALVDLFRRGPCREAMGYSSELARIRQSFSLWVPDDTENKLKKFEDAMFEMGSDAWQTGHEFAANVPNRGELIERMHETFCRLAGIGQWREKTLEQDLAMTALMTELRKALGTDEFQRLRRRTLEHTMADSTKLQ
jgi:hypothetical protein